MLKQVQHDCIQWIVILNSFQDLYAEKYKNGSLWDAETSSAWLHTMKCHPVLFSRSVRRDRQDWLAVRCWNKFSMTAYNEMSSWTRFRICTQRKTRMARCEMLKQVQHDCILWIVILNRPYCPLVADAIYLPFYKRLPLSNDNRKGCASAHPFWGSR